MCNLELVFPRTSISLVPLYPRFSITDSTNCRLLVMQYLPLKKNPRVGGLVHSHLYYSKASSILFLIVPMNSGNKHKDLNSFYPKASSQEFRIHGTSNFKVFTINSSCSVDGGYGGKKQKQQYQQPALFNIFLVPDTIPVALCILIHLILRTTFLKQLLCTFMEQETEEASLCNLSLASEWLSWNLDPGSKAYYAAC